MSLRLSPQLSISAPTHVAMFSRTRRLVEWVGTGSPPGKEQTQANCLEYTSEGANGNGVHGTSLSENLRDNLFLPLASSIFNVYDATYTRCRAGHEDQATEISGSLVAQGPCGVDESSDTVRLDGAANDGGTPGSGGTSGLLALEKFFLGVRGLRTVVSVSEHRSEDSERGGVVEDGAHGNSRGLDGWEIYIVVLLER